ncbi:MAG TPA: Stp1/IreP family PP2C-type Ser/Thr phosphatase [Terracidiphilus sp.]|nr:Stp1/IreP family PP2C-type Ser/Thr phosphatase [Terracidiphilus sp.]
MSTGALHFAATAVSDRGCKRSSNEDAFRYSVEHGVYVVCDGMGGAAAGEVASSIAVDEFVRVLTARSDSDPLPEIVELAINTANNAIYSRGQHDSKLTGMGTTLVGLVAEENLVWVVNVGDSRCYRLRAGKLEQLTQDHSFVEEQVRTGRMTHAEALRSPLRNVITRALGTQEEVTPDCFKIEAEPDDLFLLCSDGLTRELADSEIQPLLATGDPLEDRAVRVVEAAKKAGGHDNITCVLVLATP